MESKFLLSIVTVLGLILSGCGGGGSSTTGGASTPATPSYTVSTATVTEGNAGTVTIDFTVTLSEALTDAVTVDYYTSDGTATAGVDYTAIPATTVIIPAGSTTTSVSVVVNGDTLFEADETVNLHVSSSSHASLGSAIVVGTITNDDVAPSLSIASASVAEGNAGTTNLALTVTLSAASGAETTVDYVTANATAIAGSDYNVITAATLTIPAGSTTGTVNIAVFGDTILEADETMSVILSNPVNATIATAVATGTIINDETVPSLAIATVSVAEGNAGTTNLNFSVTLSAATTINTSVDFATSDGTATAGSDYTAVTGTINIGAGFTAGLITVVVSGDTIVEADETMVVTLSNPSIATLDTATAVGTITNDDQTPITMTISGKSLDFTWGADSFTGILPTNIDHYRISVNPDGASGFTVIPTANSIATLSHSVEIAVHKTDWLAAQYIVEACNLGATVCIASSNQTLALIDSVVASIYIKASNTGALDEFGWSVALSNDGNTLAVGAKFEGSNATGINGNQAVNSTINAGAVYVFVKTGATWSQQAYVKASNTGGEDRFGYAVSLSSNGNVLAISARQERSGAVGIGGNEADNTLSDAGAVYVFARIGTTWAQQAYVKASNTGAGDFFGTAVALSSDGSTLAVSTVHEDSAATGINGNQADNTATSAGAVYIFINNGITWSQQAYIKASNTEAGDQFGRSVSLNIDGNTLAVAANSEASAATGINGNQADNTAISAGAVYVFTRTGTTWTQQAYIKASNAEAGDLFGTSTSLSDDGNILAAGANFEDSTATGIGGNQADNIAGNAGAVYVFVRTGTTWLQQTYIKASNTDAIDEFGYSVSLSADGTTLAVGARREDSVASGINGNEADNTAGNSGAVYVFTNNGGIWSQKSYVKAPSTGPADWFSYSVSLSANGDTLAVGANLEDSAATGLAGNQADNTASKSGAVYLY